MTPLPLERIRELIAECSQAAEDLGRKSTEAATSGAFMTRETTGARARKFADTAACLTRLLELEAALSGAKNDLEEAAYNFGCEAAEEGSKALRYIEPDGNEFARKYLARQKIAETQAERLSALSAMAPK